MRWNAVVLTCVLAACDVSIFGPDYRFLNRRPASPQAVELFRPWYTRVESCLGTSGDFESARWFVADSIWASGQSVLGVVDLPHEVTVRVDQMWASATAHEMAHQILQRGNEIHDRHGRVPCQTVPPPRVHSVPS